MDKKAKKDIKFFPFGNDLFSEVDLDIINERIDDNLESLFAEDNYNKVDDRLLELNVKISSLLDEKILKFFHEYTRLSLEANSYKNCLAYYLGMQYGMSLRDLK